ncbi:T9SS type B sorting domain-containing protein [Hymenobacter aerophilus]|uniref:T9SS type B sorting domain-containing protein n=1 Tax=Hymenobacter aerophilus TaxID=119644 RepID=UPI0003A0CC54|nr:gliding motility-associated C-terminal domain-containing protein [Hymenobacter aerophilus]
MVKYIFLSKILLALICFSGSIINVAQAQQLPAYLWAKSNGGTGDDRGYHIALDASENIFIAGIFSGTSTFGNNTLTSRGSYDIYLAKYNSQGHLLWIQQAGGALHESVHGLCVDETGAAYITGVLNTGVDVVIGSSTIARNPGQGGLFLAKFNSQGNTVWVRFAYGLDGYVATSNSVATDGSGNVYLSGIISSSTRFDHLISNSNFNGNMFIAKYNTQGVIQWVKSDIGTTKYNSGLNDKNIAVTSTGQIYLVGRYRRGFILGSTALPDPAPALNEEDIYIAKFDSQGNPIWVKPFIGLGVETCNGLTLDRIGNIILAISFHKTISHANHKFTVNGPQTSSNSDVLILKFTSDGNLQWSQQLGGNFTFSPNVTCESDIISGLSTDYEGNIYTYAQLIGMPTLNTNDGTSTFNNHIISYCPSGSMLWSRSAGNLISDLAATPKGELLSTGYFEYTRYFDQFTLTSLGSLDMYIAKLDANKRPYSNPSCLPLPTSPIGKDIFFIPNIITPNGDGKNDVFRIVGLPVGPWQLRIYSRWGKQVYINENYQQDWNAKELPAGNYFYHLQHHTQPSIRGWLQVTR